MPEIIAKPKSWTAQVYELEIDQKIYFPGPDYNYVKSMISGIVKRKYPFRVFSVSCDDNVSVTRMPDKEEGL